METLFQREVISSLFVRNEQLQEFVRNVRAQMAHQKLTAAKVAKKAGIAPKTFNNLLKLRHAPQYDILVQIADALGVPLWQLWLPEFPPEMAHDATFPHLIKTTSKLNEDALKRVSHMADLEFQAARR